MLSIWIQIQKMWMMLMLMMPMMLMWMLMMLMMLLWMLMWMLMRGVDGEVGSGFCWWQWIYADSGSSSILAKCHMEQKYTKYTTLKIPKCSVLDKLFTDGFLSAAKSETFSNSADS